MCRLSALRHLDHFPVRMVLVPKSTGPVGSHMDDPKVLSAGDPVPLWFYAVALPALAGVGDDGTGS